MIASPLAMLVFLLGVWGRDLGQAFRQLAVGRIGRIALVGLAVVPMIGVALVGGRVAQARRLEAITQLSTIPEENAYR